MASSKKKSSKKPAAKTKKKAAPAKATKKATAPKQAAKKKAGKPAPKPAAPKKAKPAAPKKAKPAAKKPAAKKPAPPKPPKPAKQPTPADSWGNASMAPKVAATTPQSRLSEPSMSPPHALHDHAGGLVSAVGEDEELAERIHGGEEAVKNEDADDDSGSPRLDDREDEA
jgi:hypothetical protein